MRDSAWSRRDILAAMAAGTACTLMPTLLAACAAPETAMRGLALRDVLLVDGTGQPGRRTDVLVRGDRIERTGRVSDRRE